AGDHLKPASSHLKFDSAIQVPQFLDFLNDNVRLTNASAEVLLIGSPLYLDAKEPAFSMVDGYFPSDGHLQAPREKSVFGFRDTVASPLIVHWLYFGDPWISDLHREKVSRFWTLYLARRAARLAAFSGDLATVLQGFFR